MLLTRRLRPSQAPLIKNCKARGLGAKLGLTSKKMPPPSLDQQNRGTAAAAGVGLANTPPVPASFLLISIFSPREIGFFKILRDAPQNKENRIFIFFVFSIF